MMRGAARCLAAAAASAAPASASAARSPPAAAAVRGASAAAAAATTAASSLGWAARSASASAASAAVLASCGGGRSTTVLLLRTQQRAAAASCASSCASSSSAVAVRTLAAGAPRGSAAAAAAKERNRSVGMLLTAAALAMVGASYAAVPLYRLFCQVTGYGGTTQVQSEDEVQALVSGGGLEAQRRRRRKANVASLAGRVAERESQQAAGGGKGGDSDASSSSSSASGSGSGSSAGPKPLRPLTVTFNSDVNNSLPWRFRPLQQQVTVLPGESVLAFFRAKNTSKQDIIGVSTYNVTPSKMGQYFNKIQCFCFEEQRLDAGEEVDLPVLFYVDPEMVDDPNLTDVEYITLSYTFFKAADFELVRDDYEDDGRGGFRPKQEVA